MIVEIKFAAEALIGFCFRATGNGTDMTANLVMDALLVNLQVVCPSKCYKMMSLSSCWSCYSGLTPQTLGPRASVDLLS